jgi:hypothetical protein
VKVKFLSICQDEFTMIFPEVVSFACALEVWPKSSRYSGIGSTLLTSPA